MKNLYIWFPTENERRELMLSLLGMGPNKDWYLNIEPFLYTNRSEKNRYRENRKKDFSQTLDMLDRGMYSSPYLDLSYYDVDGDSSRLNVYDPWKVSVVANLGFRRIYTVNSYKRRRGFWLVLQFQDNEKGRAKHELLLQHIPTRYIGLNVPPTLYPAILRLDWLERQFTKEFDDGTAGPDDYDRFFAYLCEIKNIHPELFANEKIYLWEQLATLYSSFDEVEKSVACYLKWSELVPNSSDPYLNLGVLYNSTGRHHEAIDAYKKGLAVNPRDEYICHNLAALMKTTNQELKSLRWINEAILINPCRGVNYHLKGDAHLMASNYSAAIASLKKALALYGEDWNPLAAETCYCLAEAYQAIEKFEDAVSVLKRGLESSSTNIGILYKLAWILGEKIGNWSDGLPYAKKLLVLKPDFGDFHLLISKIYKETGSVKLALWHSKKADQLHQRKPCIELEEK